MPLWLPNNDEPVGAAVPMLPKGVDAGTGAAAEEAAAPCPAAAAVLGAELKTPKPEAPSAEPLAGTLLPNTPKGEELVAGADAAALPAAAPAAGCPAHWRGARVIKYRISTDRRQNGTTNNHHTNVRHRGTLSKPAHRNFQTEMLSRCHQTRHRPPRQGRQPVEYRRSPSLQTSWQQPLHLEAAREIVRGGISSLNGCDPHRFIPPRHCLAAHVPPVAVAEAAAAAVDCAADAAD